MKKQILHRKGRSPRGCQRINRITLCGLLLFVCLLSACTSRVATTEQSRHTRAQNRHLLNQPKPFFDDSLKVVLKPLRPTVQLSPEERQRYNAVYLSSVKERLKGNYAEAQDLLDRALEINPDAPEALYDLVMLKLDAQQYYDSVEYAQYEDMSRRAWQYDPTNDTYIRLYAYLLANNDKEEEGLNVYERFVAQHPTETNLKYLVKKYESAGHFDRALGALDYLERISGESDMISGERLNIYVEQKDTVRADSITAKFISENPDNDGYRFAQLLVYAQTDRWDRAITGALQLKTERKTAADAHPESTGAQEKYEAALYNLVKLVGQRHTSLPCHTANDAAAHSDTLYWQLMPEMGKHILSDETRYRVSLFIVYTLDSCVMADTTYTMDVFRDAILFNMSKVDANPKKAQSETEGMEAAGVASILLDGAQQYARVAHVSTPAYEKFLREIVAAAPHFSDARLQLLSAITERTKQSQDYTEIINFCQETETFTPDVFQAYYLEAIAYFQMGEDAKGDAALKKGVDAIESNLTEGKEGICSEIYMMYGDILLEAGQHKSAFYNYERALHFDPDNASCLNNYAYNLALDGVDLEKAEEMAAKAVAIEPSVASTLDTYAWVLFCRKKYEEAKVYIDSALEKMDTPSRPYVYYDHAGDIYVKLGHKAEAVAFWKQALETCDDAALTKSIQTKIRKNARNAKR